MMEYISLFLIIFIIYLLHIRKKKYHKKNENKSLNFLQKIPYKIIDNLESLIHLIELIHQNNLSTIGIDTEYFKGDEYQGHLCILQISLYFNNQTEVYIIDLLKFEKNQIFENFQNLFLDKSIQKVFHCCDNDIEWIYDEYGLRLENVFDTQEAYFHIHKNSKKPGLNDLLNQFYKLNLTKETKTHFQKSNWKQRPLSEDQLKYAAMDSYYLIHLKNILHERLNTNKKELGNYCKLMNEKLEKKYSHSSRLKRLENKGLNFLTMNLTNFENEKIEMIKSVFLELLRFNEDYAKEKNINSDKLLNFKIIYKISVRLPKDREEFIKILESFLKKEKNLNLHLNENFCNCAFFRIQDIISGNKNTIFDEPCNNLHKNSNLCTLKLKQERKEKVKDWLSCKKPVYENYLMLAPDGELLCYCDKKKMNWYIEKNLATLQSEDPPCFKLLFEPNNRGSNPDDISAKFYLKERTNNCVVCGKDDKYMRFHIIPVVYRRFFPLEYKSHNSHDIILLCLNCHEKANKLYHKQKEVISKKYNVPLIFHSEEDDYIKNLQEHKSTAATLYRNYEKIPDERKIYLKNILLEFLNTHYQNEVYEDYYKYLFIKKEKDFDNFKLPFCLDHIDKEFILIIKSFTSRSYFQNQKEKKNNHGKIVIQYIENFHDFIMEWRAFFKNSMNPKYLPEQWDIEHDFYANEGRQSKFSKKSLKGENRY
jgi:cobalt/nickel-transporting P-type ATPase D